MFDSLFRIIEDNLEWVKRSKGITSGWRVLVRKASCVEDTGEESDEDYMSYQINEVLHAMIAAAPTPTQLGVRLIERAEEKGKDGGAHEDSATDADEASAADADEDGDADENGATDADVDGDPDAEKSGWSYDDPVGYEVHMATQRASAAAAAAAVTAAAAAKKNKTNKSRVKPERSSQNAEKVERTPKRARRSRAS